MVHLLHRLYGVDAPAQQVRVEPDRQMYFGAFRHKFAPFWLLNDK